MRLLPQQKNEKKNTPLYFADAGFKPNSGKESGKGGWGLKAEISPMFATQMQSGAASNAKAGTSISGGMLASYRMNDKITLSSGIRLTQMKQGSHSDYTMAKTSGITYLQPVQKDANLSGRRLPLSPGRFQHCLFQRDADNRKQYF